MDLLSFIKNEFFRPIATLVIPGSIAFSTWSILAVKLNPGLLEISKSGNGLLVTIFIGLSLAVGMLLEDLGSKIEVIFDKKLYKLDPLAKKRWSDYLKLELKDELVGQRYLRTLLIRLKFELSMFPAILSCYAGLWILNFYTHYWEYFSLIFIGIPVAILEYYLWHEIQKSVSNLDFVRGLIIESKSKVEAPGASV